MSYAQMTDNGRQPGYKVPTPEVKFTDESRNDLQSMIISP
jgi:predicted aspartyl protease